jgi:hypothetical protein
MQDFKEFLKLLNEHEVEYLLIGGYAVGYYGYPRTTADMDIWFAVSPENASKLYDVFQEFGMTDPCLSPDSFLQPKTILRMGLPPVRIEVMGEIDGVAFDECYKNRVCVEIDSERVNLISKPDLLKNKLASGRYKDLDDIENLTV